MKYAVEYLPDKNIVRVKINGRLNFQSAEQYSREAVKLARQNNCTRFLIDHKETTKSRKTNNIHVAGDELQQFGFKDIDHIAIVVADKEEESVLTEPTNENARQSCIKYFYSNNTHDAYAWLLKSV